MFPKKDHTLDRLYKLYCLCYGSIAVSVFYSVLSRTRNISSSLANAILYNNVAARINHTSRMHTADFLGRLVNYPLLDNRNFVRTDGVLFV